MLIWLRTLSFKANFVWSTFGFSSPPQNTFLTDYVSVSAGVDACDLILTRSDRRSRETNWNARTGTSVAECPHAASSWKTHSRTSRIHTGPGSTISARINRIKSKRSVWSRNCALYIFIFLGLAVIVWILYYICSGRDGCVKAVVTWARDGDADRRKCRYVWESLIQRGVIGNRRL